MWAECTSGLVGHNFSCDLTSNLAAKFEILGASHAKKPGQLNSAYYIYIYKYYICTRKRLQVKVNLPHHL